MNDTIRSLVASLDKRYGNRWEYYGTVSPVGDNIGFRIEGIDATFSVSTHGGELPTGMLDIQIEHKDPGTYIFTEEYEVGALLSIIPQFSRPIEEWPANAS